MLFIQFMNEKNMFFAEQLGVIVSGCVFTIMCGHVLQSDDVVWAVFMVQAMIIIYCIMWSIIVWKIMNVVMRKGERENNDDDLDLPDLVEIEDDDDLDLPDLVEIEDDNDDDLDLSDLPDLITEEELATIRANTIAETIAKELEADLADDYCVNMYDLRSLMLDEETWDRWDIEKVVRLKKSISYYERMHPNRVK
jgi:hypothetical protein